MTSNPAPASAEDPAELERRLALLQGVSILFTLDTATLRRLARRARRRAYAPSEKILGQRQPAETLFVVESGTCEVVVKPSAGHGISVSLLSRGDFFGIDLADDSGHSLASVQAVNKVAALLVTLDDLSEAVEASSQAWSDLEKIAAQQRFRVQRIVARASAPVPERSAQLIAVYSPQGGAGKTSLAVNLATALAVAAPSECLLLDMALPFNHAAINTNLIPTHSLALSERAGLERFEETILSSILHHPGGMLLLPGTQRVEHSELITTELAERAVEVLSRHFAQIVVDLGVSLGEVPLAILERAHRVVLLLTTDSGAIKDTAEVLEILRGVLGIPEGRITLVLNHPRPGSKVTKEAVERILQRPIHWEIAHDGGRAQRANTRGDILVLTEPGSAMARTATALAASIRR